MPSLRSTSAGPITGSVLPAAATAADTEPAGTVSSSSFGLVSPWITGLPPASTSTAGAAAVCRTTSRACPAATLATSFLNGVTVGLPSASRCATSVDVGAFRQVRIGGQQRRTGAVGGVRREDRDLVRARGQVDRALAGAGLEVVERLLAVHVHVDGRLGDAVHHVDGGRRSGRSNGHGGQRGQQRGHEPGARQEESSSHTPVTGAAAAVDAAGGHGWVATGDGRCTVRP